MGDCEVGGLLGRKARKGKEGRKGRKLTALSRPSRRMILIISEVVGFERDQADERGLLGGRGDGVGLEGCAQGHGGLRGGAAFVGEGRGGAAAGFRGDLEELCGCYGLRGGGRCGGGCESCG